MRGMCILSLSMYWRAVRTTEEQLMLKAHAILAFLLVFSSCGRWTPVPPSPPIVGPQGTQGVAGTDAQPCTVVSVPEGAQIFCPDGSSQIVLNGESIIGPQGIPGHDGESIMGPQGDPGTPGTPGTAVTAVQFCPNEGPTVYPTTFPEQGICISGDLYGVYFDSTNAWLAKIVPGVYNSTATGLGCTFTVGDACSVTQD